MKQLYEVYENNIDEVGKFSINKSGNLFTLVPISHVVEKSDIEVILNDKAVVHDICFLNGKRTIIPATIKSENRTSNVAPHLLHDELGYVANNLVKYTGNQRDYNKYQEYIKQFESVIEYCDYNEKLQTIFKYVKYGNIIDDLLKYEMLDLNNDGKLINLKNKKNITKLFIRFTLLQCTPNDLPVWDDKKIYQIYKRHVNKQMLEYSQSGICYILGDKKVLSDTHGSDIRFQGDTTKLISSNDSRGFTFRGRFENENQAVQISYEASQKIHNALRWIIERQGFYIDSRYFVVFGVEKLEDVSIFDGSTEILSEYFEDSISNDDSEILIITEEIMKAFKGRHHNFKIEGINNIIILAFDAATPKGRLAIVYYQQLSSELFLNSLSKWHSSCQWYQVHYSNEYKKYFNFIGTPSTYHIVEAVYGDRGDPRIKKELYTRLLPCIVEGAKIPKDIIYLIFNRIKNPFSFNKLSEWNRTINIACALIHREYEEETQVGLDTGNKSRDYLFGRLLGTAEAFESNELLKRNDDRATNATRYFNAFTQHPARVWLVIQKQLHPYKLKPSEFGYRYIKMLQEIESEIKLEDMNNKPLGPQFLLGYSSQIRDFYTKKRWERGNRK